MKSLLPGVAGALALVASLAQAQPQAQTQAQTAQSVAAPAPLDEAEVRLHNDWAWLARYQADDAAVKASGRRPDVVFMGDSITQGWLDKDPGFFRQGRIDRGISGQTSPQMLVRFRQDVIALHPRAVHIMMGTNDIAGNTGPMSAEQTEDDFRSLSELARANGICVILASIPPASGFPWRPGLETAVSIRGINAWIRDYATHTGAVYADYTAVLDDGQGGMKPGLANDGVHPTQAGYAAMAPVAEQAIARALHRCPAKSGGRRLP